MITPCVNVLRQLAKTINEILGYDQGLRHATVDISKDIASLMVSLDDRNVYQLTRGRKLDEDQLVIDVVALGLEALTTGHHNPLHEYNETFEQYQKRRRMSPVDINNTSPPSTPPLTPSPPLSPTLSPESFLKANSVNYPHVVGYSSNESTSDVSTGDHGTLDELQGDSFGELAMILDDLARGIAEPTLSLEGEDDVTLDFEEEFDDKHGGVSYDDLFEEPDAEPEAEIEEIEKSDMDFIGLW